MLLDPQAISMMPPELENAPMSPSDVVDLMQRTSLEEEEQQQEAVSGQTFAPKGSLV